MLRTARMFSGEMWARKESSVSGTYLHQECRATQQAKGSRFDSPLAVYSWFYSCPILSTVKLSCSLEHLILCVAPLSAWFMPLHAQPQLSRARASLKRHQAHLSFWFWVWREGTKPRTQSSFIQKGNGWQLCCKYTKINSHYYSLSGLGQFRG